METVGFDVIPHAERDHTGTQTRTAKTDMDMLMNMAKCHWECKKVNTILKTEQMNGDHLKEYETVPGIEEGTGIFKPFCFRIDVKKDT